METICNIINILLIVGYTLGIIGTICLIIALAFRCDIFDINKKLNNMNAVINCNPSGLYPIGEAAQILGINRRTLLRHTMAGDIKCSIRRATGRKVYKGSELIKYHNAIL